MRFASDDVFDEFQRGNLPLENEEVVAFALGYMIRRRRGNSVGFDVEHAPNPLSYGDSLSFKPDVDILEAGTSGEEFVLRAYEVKSRRNSNQLKELYSGLGQAMMLQSQPINDDPIFNQVYLATPKVDVGEQWFRTFLKTIEDSPVGLVIIDRDDFEVLSEPETNLEGDYSKRAAEVAGWLRGKENSKQNPAKGLSERAESLIEKQDIKIED